MHSLYRSSTRGPEDDSVESKHVAPLSHYMFNFTTVVFDGTSPAFYFTNTSGWNTSSSFIFVYRSKEEQKLPLTEDENTVGLSYI